MTRQERSRANSILREKS